MKKLYFLLISVFVITNLFSQSSIADARLMPVGSIVTVTGVITNGEELGTIRYMQDTTAGIAIYDYNLSYLQRGDSVIITGELDDYNNLLEIKNVSIDSVISSGNILPEPELTTPGQLTEMFESEIVQLDDAIFDNAGMTFQGGNSYSFTANGSGSTVYIRTSHPLIGEIIPGNAVTLIGICSQFYANYQLLLRDTNDIINDSYINIISTIAVSNLTTSGFDLSWTTDSAGTTGILYGNTTLLEMGELLGVGFGTEHIISITGASPSEIFYVQAFSVRSTDTAFSNTLTYCTQSVSSGDIKVYFTMDADHTVSTGTDAIKLDDLIDDTLINYINRAKYSIDIAIYDFNVINIEDIAGALNNAFSNGVNIRAIYDTTWSDVNLGSLLNMSIHSLIAPNDAEYGIMHNKFVVIDAMSSDANDPIVWTGSTNFEDANINEFANNVIIIQDQSLAKAYRLEFNEMWGSDTPSPEMSISRFGPYKKDNTPHEFIIGGNRVECYFSPSDGTTGHIVKTIESADEELYIETMLITRYDLRDAIIERDDAGVLTQVLVNDDADCNSTIVDDLTIALTNFFREYGEPGILHHKSMIVDPNYISSDPLVLTGSHNWSNNAENRNDENTVIVHNAEIANIYYQEFKKRFDNGISLSFIEDIDQVGFTNQYPNPFKDIFWVEIESAKNEKALLEIFNLEGQIIYSRSLNLETGKTFIEINDFNAASGIYILKVQGSERNFSFRVVKE